MTTQTAAPRTRAAQKRAGETRRGRAAAAEAGGTAPARSRSEATAEKRTTAGRGRTTATAEKRTAGRRRETEEAAGTRSVERRRERERERQAAEREPSANGGKGINLPLVGHVDLPAVPIPVPRVKSLPGQVLWLGGLAGVAVLGVIEWPVAAAIAAGTWIAERWAKSAISEGAGRARERQA